MGKVKTRLSSRKSAKRWRKGQSSSSNPETKKHRENAKSFFFQETLGSTGLTKDKLKKHDVVQGSYPYEKEKGTARMEDEEEEEENTLVDDGASTFKTFDTFASSMSNCSNMSFNRFLNHYQSNSEIHKQMLAVLSAVTEVIKEKGGSESSTEYYSALMTTLGTAEAEESIAAILSLLGMVLKTVPQSVLRHQFSQASQVILQILYKYAMTENFLIQRHCIGCISLFLRAQEAVSWSNSSTMQILDGILAFTTHEKPKLRKAAQHSVCALLKGSDIMKGENPLPCHPATTHVAKTCLAQLESAGQPGQLTSALHTLTLLKDICHQFPKNYVKTLCERLLGIMTMHDIKAKSCCFQTLYTLFVSRPSESTLPPQLNGQIINALYDYQPSSQDEKLVPVWLIVMQEAHCNLASTSLQLCAANVPRFVEKCMEICLSERRTISRTVPKTIETVLQMCVAPLCTDQESAKTYNGTLLRTIQIVKNGMNYQYNGIWGYMCSLLAVLFQIIAPNCKNELIQVLKELADLRESANFTYKDEADYAMGAAVKSFGPRIVLQILPLELGKESMNVNRCDWLLPILENCTCNSTIEYFANNLVPLALMCEKKSAHLKKENSTADAHVYNLLKMRIWALLPSFCNSPTDIKDNFPSVAKLLGTALNSKKELRMCILSGLRKLVLHSTRDEKLEDIEQLTRFAKNYLPILFNIYTTKPSGSNEEAVRSVAFDTIKTYLTIANEELIRELFDKGLEKLQNTESDDFMKESIFDLIRLLTQFTDIDRLKTLYAYCKPLLKTIKKKKLKDQKKAYRFLEEICGSESEVCKEFVSKNRKSIQATLVFTAEHAFEPSKGSRIRTIAHLVESHPKLERTEFFDAIVPEAVLCTKQNNMRCRVSSFDLLNAMAAKFLSNEDNFKEYIGMLVAGLEGPPIYCSAALMALTSMLYNYNGSLGVKTVLQMLDRVSELMKEPAREIVQSALPFVKVYLRVMPTTIVGPTLGKLLNAISGMTEDCKRHFRLLVRDILVKMVRKFGAQVISGMIPASDEIMHKRLRNIRKIEDKKQREKKDRKAREDEEDEEGEEEFSAKRKPKSIEEILADSDEEFDKEETQPQKKRVSRKNKAWIKEDEENIVDLIDPTAAKNITATQPAQKGRVGEKEEQGKSKKHDFKKAPDGRLIIKDGGSDDEEDAEVRRKMKNMSFLGKDKNEDEEVGSGYEDNDDNDGDDVEMDKKSVKSVKSMIMGKRKRKFSAGTESVVSGARSVASTYKAGGSGIHRPVKMPKTEKLFGTEYRAKKALGDVKKKGKPDPYAYLPLKRSTLNRRKKMKNAGRFKNIVSNARKGAQSDKKKRSK